MTIEIWRALGYLIAAVITTAIFVAFLRNRPIRQNDSPLAASKGEIIVVITVIGVGLLLRANFLTEFQGGFLTSDENMMSIAYTSGIINGEHVRSGAGKIIYALVLDAWLHLFGLSVTAIRSLSTVASIAGIVFWFLSLRLLCGQRIALWASALLSISVFGIYFGRLSLEIYWTIVFAPLCLLFYAYWKLHPSRLNAALAGSAVALGLFTYPGSLLALLAILCGLAAALLLFLITASSEKTTLKPSRDTALDAAVALAAFLVVNIIGFTLHYTVYAPPGEGAFTGGGGGYLNLSLASILAAIQQLLVDLFIEGSSWYLHLPAMPFVEFVLWPFFITGVMISWGRARDWKIRGIILSMPVVILLAALTGAYPGMRRAIYFLLPFYYFSAIRIVQFFELVKNLNNHSLTVSRYMTSSLSALILVAVALAHPIYYQLTYGRKAVSWNHGEGFGTKKIPLEFISEILLTNDVFLYRHEFDKYFDHLIYEHYPKLAKRYGNLNRDARDVHFLESRDEPTIKTLGYRDDWRFLTWESREVTSLSKLVPVCVDDQSFSENSDTPIVVYRDSIEADKNGALCVNNGEMEWLDSKFQMGYRHSKERFIHQLDCAGPYCDKRRPDSIYTLGGTVAFLLAPKPGECDQGCQLVLQIDNPKVGRKSRILISNKQIGLLSIEGLDEGNKARFPIPGKILTEGGAVEVKITPEPGDYLGWDIRSAEIVRAGL